VGYYKISFAGAGNVAGALCKALHEKKHIIEHIVSRNEVRGLTFANDFNSTWSDNYSFPSTSELIIVSVPDNAIKEILGRIKCNKNAIVLHTSGSVGIDVFKGHFTNYGVLYPLQTFSSGRNHEFSSIPLFIEGSDNSTLHIIQDISGTLSKSVYHCDSEHRRMLHLAAVFSCNFTNHMMTRGKELANRAGFPFEILEPLLKETIQKAFDKGPENSQTGPAVRNDTDTLKKHLEMLSFSPEMRDIYELISRSIANYNINPKE
jgi:predicted short-subunit dehydrogenase-like oxidoreductase (DUF2520 family)